MKRCTIGIAGYMGSGKTTCSRALAAEPDVFVVDGDVEARGIMLWNASLQHRLTQSFGEGIVENGTIDFGKLGALVFSDLRELRKLNAIVHPLLLDRLRKTIFERENGIIVVDAAVLPLWNIEDWLDLRIWIDASSETRFARLLHKNSALSAEDIRARMRQQEALFPPPDTENWIYVANERDAGTLCDAVRSHVRKYVGGS